MVLLAWPFNRTAEHTASSSSHTCETSFCASVSRRSQVQSRAPSDAAGVAVYNSALKAALVRSTLAFIADRDNKLGLSDEMRLRVDELEAQLERTDEQVVSLQESLERATDALRSRDRALEVRVGVDSIMPMHPVAAQLAPPPHSWARRARAGLHPERPSREGLSVLISLK